jgi:putative ABC transport system permease protein
MQVALSLVLVVGAALFARTFYTLTTQRSGFDRDPVLVVEVNAQKSAVSREQRPALFERLREAAAAVPGVSRAAVSFTSPVGASGWNTEVVAGAASLGRRERMSWINAVSPGWFDTYGVRLIAGRDVSTADPPGARMAVVNRTFAERFMGGGNPVGRTFRTRGPSGPLTEYEVIGLVEDAVYRSLRAGMMPTMYIPLSQWEDPGADAVIGIRSAGAPPLTLARSALDAIARSDGGIALSYHSLTAQVNASLTQERLLATLSVFFGGLATLLAGLGLYGLTSYSVSSRRTEIGIRLALGANPSRVVWLVVRRVAWLVGFGVFAGAAIALWASRFVSALLYDLEPGDPSTLASAAAILALAAALAAWLPARRASRTDPTIVLRES